MIDGLRACTPCAFTIWILLVVSGPKQISIRLREGPKLAGQARQWSGCEAQTHVPGEGN